MDSESGGMMEVAALGRPFGLGMLYDCRSDLLVPGMTLWDHGDLIKHVGERPQNYTDFEIVASDSIEDKSSALNIEASLKASFLSGLVYVKGSAKYLNDSKTSRNQARVTLKYEVTTKVQELSMNHLGKDNVKHPYVFEKGLATHVVTAILYGAQAFFVFDRDVSEQENRQDIQGKLKMMIDKIPSIAVGGKGSLNLEDKDRENVENFSCRFYGDFSLQKTPTSFQDAVEVYQSLPKLLGANGENAVPMKVWLLPLTILDYSAAKLVHQINIRFVQEAQRVLEELSELEIRCNDALRTTTVQQFPQIGEKLRGFKDNCCGFKLQFQKDLAKKLPLIRGGGEEETVLAEIVNKRHFSPFNSKTLSEWMDCKEREIYTLMSFTNMMKNTVIVPSQNHLYKESLSAQHVVCFVFTSLGSADPYLSALSEDLKGRTTPGDPQDPHTPDVEEVQWFTSKEILGEVRNKAKLFIDFAEANKENQNIRFLTVGLKDETQKGSSIYLYKDGFSVSENFEPPSKPETVTVSDINHNSVTLKISPPTFGAENITSYSVEYCVSGEDGWQQKTAAKSEDVTVSDLRLKTQYMFRCRAMTSVGVGPANEVSGSIKTLPCSPPAKPQVEPNSTEISVSWEKPAELGQDVQVLSYIVEYATTDNRGKDEDLEWNQMVSSVEHVIISELQSGTEYVVRVRCDCGEFGSSKESSSVKVCTKNFSRLAEVLRCTSNRINSECPTVYNLPLNKQMHNKGYQRFTFGKESMRQNRTIVLSGVTGSGKSTLINGMINYIVGVEWKDNFRLKITDENQSSTLSKRLNSEVTVYKINHQDGFKVPFSLTVVDIPDLGETRCIERDKKVLEQLCHLLSTDTVTEIDAVCFVVQAALGELTPSQKSCFDYVLSVFGKGLSESIRILATFPDEQLLPLLDAINASGVPCPKRNDGLPVHFKFNNSALFAQNKSPVAKNTGSDDDSDEDVSFEEMLWERGTKRMKRFFTALNVMDTKSLTLAKEVIRERQQLENSVEQLQEEVKVGLAKLQEINDTTKKLNMHMAEISRNENFEFQVTVTKLVRVDVSHSKEFFTNCQQCHMTCHYPHGDEGKTGCATLGSDGRCTVCPGKCYWNVHFIQKFRWDYKEVKERHKFQELKEKFPNTTEDETHVQTVVKKLRAECDLVRAEFKKHLESSAECLDRLKEVAQKPVPLTTPEYIDLLIEGEKSTAKPGWKQRVRYLKEQLPLRKLFKRFFQIPHSKGRDPAE